MNPFSLWCCGLVKQWHLYRGLSKNQRVPAGSFEDVLLIDNWSGVKLNVQTKWTRTILYCLLPLESWAGEEKAEHFGHALLANGSTGTNGLWGRQFESVGLSLCRLSSLFLMFLRPSRYDAALTGCHRRLWKGERFAGACEGFAWAGNARRDLYRGQRPRIFPPVLLFRFMDVPRGK